MLLGEVPPAPKPDAPEFRLLPCSPDSSTVRKYFTEVRRIDEDVTDFFLSGGNVYESADYHNAVFIGRDEHGIPGMLTAKERPAAFAPM